MSKISIVTSFPYKEFEITWINAVSKCGYLQITKNQSSPEFQFTNAWLLAEKIDRFLRNEPKISAEDVGCHMFSYDPDGVKLFIFPRYSGDYKDSNETYDIAESSNQEETSSEDVILPLVLLLQNYLSTL